MRRAVPRAVWASAGLGGTAVLVLGLVGRATPFYYDDGVIALNLLAGRGFSLAFHGPFGPTASQAPLHPALLAVVHGLLGTTLAAVAGVLALRALAHAAAVLGTFAVARAGGIAPRWATAVAVVVAFHPLLLRMAATVEYLDRRATIVLPFMLLAAAATASACRAQVRPGQAFRAGLATGLAALADAPFLLFALPASVVLAFGGGHRRPVRALLFLAGTALVVAPWTLRNASAFHAFVPVRSSFGLRFWVGNNSEASGRWDDQEIADDPERLPRREGAFLISGHATTLNFHPRDTLPAAVLERLPGTNEVERDRILMREGLRFVRSRPGRFAALTARRVLYLAAGAGRPPEAREGGRQRAGRAVTAACLAAGFLIALAAPLWRHEPMPFVIGCVLASSLAYYGPTNVALPDQRWVLEPFVLVAAATLLPRRAAPPGTAAGAAARPG